MNKHYKLILASLILSVGILIYVHDVSAEGLVYDGSLRTTGLVDGQDFVALREDSNSDDSRDGEEGRLRIKREIRIINKDGNEQRVRFEIEQEEKNGKIKRKIKFSESDVEAETELEIEEESDDDSSGRLRTKLSNGRDAEIKIMPEVASERALERLRLKVCREENGCTIVLKEVGKGEEVKAAYEINAEEESRILGLFKARLRLRSHVDAETGEVIKIEKPWWAFLARYENTA